MKNILIKYGGFASAVVVGFPVLTGLLVGYGPDNFALSEVIGYTSIIVAMASVYFAMKHYRDNENAGAISFGQGMKIGLAISSVGGVAFALYNLVFVTWIMPDFNEQYYAYSSGNKVGTPQFETGYAELMETQGFMFSKLGGSPLMFATVFMIGLVISLISAMILQKKAAASAAKN